MSQETSGASSPTDSSRPGIVRPGSKTPALVRGVQNFTLIFLIVGIVALYSSFRRPIWIDEMLHFAWGGIENPFSAFGDVLQPLMEGSAPTWFSTSWLYFLADIGLLHVFGANSTALRAPSLLAAFGLLVLVTYFFRQLGLGFVWQLTVLLVLLAQTSYMHYAGEARPYMPMSLAVVALMFYFSLGQTAKASIGLSSLAWTAGVLGSLLHTYVVIYALVFSFGFAWINSLALPPRDRRQRVVSLLNLPLLGVMGGIEIVTRLPSVIGTQNAEPAWQGGPWEFLQPIDLPSLFLFSHFGFLPLFPGTFITVLVISVLALSFLLGRGTPLSREDRISLTKPILLIFLSLGVSIGISALSYFQDYWILARHWTASALVVPIGFVWLVAELSGALSRRGLLPSWIIPAALITLFISLAPWKIAEQANALRGFADTAMNYQQEWAGTTAEEAEALWGKADVQNINIYLGGPVWPVNACFNPVWQNCPSDFEIPD